MDLGKLKTKVFSNMSFGVLSAMVLSIDVLSDSMRFNVNFRKYEHILLQRCSDNSNNLNYICTYKHITYRQRNLLTFFEISFPKKEFLRTYEFHSKI